jgi:hypothetical protein
MIPKTELDFSISFEFLEAEMTTITARASKLYFLTNRIHLRRGLAFGVIIITALFAFETFNYSTTEFALSDLLGGLKFANIPWSTILAIAFCGIDFAGIARLFTPAEGDSEPSEVWYLFGAWLLAATMNAMLTWWGVTIAILNHETLGNAVVTRDTLLRVVPVFVAVMVWLIRVLIIGTFSVSGGRLFSQAGVQTGQIKSEGLNSVRTLSRSMPNSTPPRNTNQENSTASYKAASKPVTSTSYRPEPTYHPVITARPNGNGSAQRGIPTLKR